MSSSRDEHTPARTASRRGVLRAVGLGAGLAATGAGLATLVDACGRASKPSGGRNALRPAKFGWMGGTCEAPAFAAYHQGFFQREGLKVELVNLGQSTARDALASGKVDAVAGITFEWLKPIEQGQDIRVTGGIHGGCLRLVVGAGSGITTLQGLRGKSIATDDIGGSAHSFFSVVLAANGVDPQKDVTFVKFPGAQLQTALQRGEVKAVAAADPFPFLIVSSGDGVELASNLTGTYQDHFCCALGINGPFVDESPATAAALTRALLSAAKWIGNNVDRAAQIETEHKYVPIDAAVAAKLLATYTWQPSVVRLRANLDQYAREFKTTGILEKGTDPAGLVKRAFRDVTGGDGGINATDPSASGPATSPSTPTSPGASGSAAAASPAGHEPPADTYLLTAAQRAQLLTHACHISAAGNV